MKQTSRIKTSHTQTETYSARNKINEKIMKTKKASQQKTHMPVSEFLELYDNKKTKYNYTLALTIYLKEIYPEENPTTKNIQNLDRLAREYLRELKKERNLFHDVKLAANNLAKKYAPKTARLHITIILLWLEDNGYKLTRTERKRIFKSLPAPQTVRKDPELKAELFAAVINHMPKWTQTLMIVLAGTGMRIGEAFSLSKTDIHKTDCRVKAEIKAENSKTKTERTVYLTKEASKALEEYLRTRKDKNEKLFPHTAWQAQYELKKAKLKAAAEYGSDAMLIHWHITRKWFISRFNLSASKPIGELLIGHAGYLDTAYRKYSKDTVIGEFIKAEKELNIAKA